MDLQFRLWLEDIQKHFPFMLPKPVSPEDARKLHFFGPVYHGTTPEKHTLIQHQGFQFFKGGPRTGATRHGYEMSNNYGAIESPPPIHHLGFGSYFTTVKNIAKDFNQGTTKGLSEFYIGGANFTRPRIEEINFGSTNTMMKWWRKYGYNMPSPKSLDSTQAESRWVQETQNLTDNLKSQFDAVHFKGKGLKRLLDGNQICVYRPEECIYVVDYRMSAGYEMECGVIKVGDKVQIKGTKTTTYVAAVNQPKEDDPWQWAYPSKYAITCYFKSGDEIARKYGPGLRAAIEEAERNGNEWIASRQETVEKNIKNYPDKFPADKTAKEINIDGILWWYLEPNQGLKYHFPSSLIAGILQPRQRVRVDWASY